MKLRLRRSDAQERLAKSRVENPMTAPRRTLTVIRSILEFVQLTYFPVATEEFEEAAPFRRISAANSLISVKSRCISLQPYHVA